MSASVLVARVRKICLSLPEAEEGPGFQGVRFKVRRRVFAQAFEVEDPSGVTHTMCTFRSVGEEREFLVRQGHPFFAAGPDVGVLLGDATDWTELRELVTESYRVLAPKKLAELLP